MRLWLCLSLLFVYGAVLDVGGALAQSTKMNCQQAATYALKHNPELRAIRAKALIATRRLNASRIFPSNPELESTGKGKLKSDKFGFYKLESSLTWKFPIGGYWTQQQHLAKTIFERVQAEIQAKTFSIVLKTQKTCFQLLIEKEKQRLYQDIYTFYQRTLKIVNTRKKTGAATILDVNFARLELLQSQASLRLAKAEVKAQVFALRALLGWAQRRDPVIQDQLATQLQVKATRQQLLKRSLTQNVMLEVIKRRINEQKATLRYAEAKAIPDLKLKFFYAFEQDGGDNHIIGGGIAIPLPFLQRNQTKVWTTRAKIQQVRLKMRAMIFKMRQQIAQRHTRYLAGWEVFQLYERQLIPTFKKQLALRFKGLRLGTFSILKVISAQQSQNKALLRRIDSLKQVLNSYISLQQVMGRSFR